MATPLNVEDVLVAGLCGALVLMACSGHRADMPSTPPPTPLAGSPASVTKSAGDAQVAAPGAAVSIAPAVVVADRLGNPIPNVDVEFAVTAGGGDAWCGPTKTDASGRASCPIWTVGKGRGTYSLSATVAGLAPAVFTASVQADVVLELGHTQEVSLLKLDGTRLLSWDVTGRWVLWDAESHVAIASGSTPCAPPLGRSVCTPSSVDLAGPAVLIASPSGLEVRDASDGRLLSRIEGSYSWARLARDGSYVYAASSGTLSAWRLDGRPLLSRPGDYSRARTFADGAALRVGGGPAGANVIETIEPSTGTSSVGAAFNGAFHSWFTDGQRFITNLSTTIWVYSSGGTQEAILSLPTIENLTGQGTWLWTHEPNSTDKLSVYSVSGGGTAAASYALGPSARVFPGKDSIGVAYRLSSLAVRIDLSGPSPTWSSRNVPFVGPSAVAATPSARWFVASGDGRILDASSQPGTPQYCGRGLPSTIGGGGDRVAVATAAGSILVLNAATGLVEREIAWPASGVAAGEVVWPSTKLQLSSDGTVLAANGNHTLAIFSLPSGAETRTLPYQGDTYPRLADFTLSASGAQLGQVFVVSASSDRAFEHQVSPVAGGAPTWTGSTTTETVFPPQGETPILLSPSGRRVAFSSGYATPGSVTNLYQDGALVSAVAGRAVGWIDEDRVLVNVYAATGFYGTTTFVGAEVHDATGALLTTLALPELTGFQTVSAKAVFSPSQNAILSLETGATVWAGHQTSRLGAVAAGRVVHPVGPYLVSEAY